MRRLPAALLAAALLLPPLPVRAGRTYTPTAPEFPLDTVWLNAKPLTLKQVRLRRAVLVAFFSTANLNSFRALAALKAWNERYELNGLLIVGVHAPEFGFQRDPLVVRAALKRLGVRFPVFLDNNRKYWQELGNEGWPSLFLFDYKSHIIFDHLGEGGYSDFEGEIRDALNTAGFAVPDVPALYPDPRNLDCGDMTTDLSLGLRRGRALPMAKAPGARAMVTSARDGETAYAGRWEIEADDIRLAQKNPEQTALLRLVYRGSHAFAVLSPPAGKAGSFFVRQDQMWLHPGNAGKDIQFDDDGRSYVTSREPGLFNLTQNPDDALHVLTLMPDLPGSAVYDFSFSDRCLDKDLP
ncbi:MAG: hypothetical protein NTY77_06145 [Elusimicrobia bacterium]|nr:hypothetical protein [Elusimicrobiota bacterium]